MEMYEHLDHRRSTDPQLDYLFFGALIGDHKFRVPASSFCLDGLLGRLALMSVDLIRCLQLTIDCSDSLSFWLIN
jgi:hypothetical protein